MLQAFVAGSEAMLSFSTLVEISNNAAGPEAAIQHGT